MQNFLSCDWGTSSFRLRLVQQDGTIAATVENKEKGIASIHRDWKSTAGDAKDRFHFYRNIISQAIEKLQTDPASIEGLPVIVSGMVSSTLGMLPLDYKELPFETNGSDLIVQKFGRTALFGHELLIISGVKNHNDVMRGEETQLIGALDDEPGDALYIFPGTHSKHVMVRNGFVIDIKTFMTGEIFSLLSEKSVLSNSVEPGDGLSEKKNAESFETGVLLAQKENFLHAVFTVRTNQLLDKLTAEQNYYYLSGLLIGSELRSLEGNHRKLVLVAGESFQPLYVAALQLIDSYSGSLEIRDADMALIKGQQKIASHFFP